MWFDTHFHLDEEDDAEKVFADARTVDVTRFLVLGTSYEDCPRTVALASPEKGVYVAAGLHPHVADSFVDTQPFREWLSVPGAIAVGEIGLTGELRNVPNINQRLQEISRLGFKRCVIPAHCKADIKAPEGLKILPARNVREAINAVVI